MVTTNDDSVRVAVIEHDQIEREYLAALLGSARGIVVSGTYASLAEFLGPPARTPPEIVLVDGADLDRFGKDALRTIHAEMARVAVVVLSDDTKPQRFFPILEEGISGWLEKPCQADQLVRCISLVRDGEAVLGSQAARAVLEYFRARGLTVSGLSKREREILDCLARGLQAHEMAGRLGVSKGTVRSHLHKILAKMRVSSQAGALAKYFNPAGSNPNHL